jgi:stage IV sporulation protein B
LLENAVAYPVGYKQDIEPGEAEIISDIDGTIAHYKIRITEVNYRKNKENKSILFEVEDAALLESTGGIVQGMSGSPVIQNGRLIGAVTHVFVDDAKKGYGIFIEDMLEMGKTSNP